MTPVFHNVSLYTIEGKSIRTLFYLIYSLFFHIHLFFIATLILELHNQLHPLALRGKSHEKPYHVHLGVMFLKLGNVGV